MASETEDERRLRMSSLDLTQVLIKYRVYEINSTWYGVTMRPPTGQRLHAYGKTPQEAERAAQDLLDQVFGLYGYRLEKL